MKRLSGQSTSRFPLEEGLTFGISSAGVDARLRCDSKEVELAEFDAVWWRRPTPSTVDAIVTATDREYAGIECDHSWQGTLWSLEALWVNDPFRQRAISRKPTQLVRARDAGLIVPTTLITTDISEIREFFDAYPEVIAKRTGVGPGAMSQTKVVTLGQVLENDTVSAVPPTFQKYIDGRADYRVIWIDQTQFAVRIDSQSGSSPVDCRFDNSVDFKLVDLPTDLSQAIDQFMYRAGLRYGAIDLREDKDGCFVFLEINPSGQFAYLELKTDAPIMARLAMLLAEGPTEIEIPSD